MIIEGTRYLENIGVGIAIINNKFILKDEFIKIWMQTCQVAQSSHSLAFSDLHARRKPYHAADMERN